MLILAQKGQTLPYMFYCIYLPHIIFHRSNSTAPTPHCTSQQLNHCHSSNHATQSKVNPVQDCYTIYTAIIIALCGVRGAPALPCGALGDRALPCGRRWNAVPTGQSCCSSLNIATRFTAVRVYSCPAQAGIRVRRSDETRRVGDGA